MAARDIIDKVKKEIPTTKLSENTAGEIFIADDVVAMIAALAAGETEGVASVGQTYTRELMSKVGMKDKTQGVKVSIEDGIVRVALSISIKGGYSIPSTSQQIQSKIKSSVETMTGMTVKSVNVHVIGVEI